VQVQLDNIHKPTNIRREEKTQRYLLADPSKALLLPKTVKTLEAVTTVKTEQLEGSVKPNTRVCGPAWQTA